MSMVLSGAPVATVAPAQTAQATSQDNPVLSYIIPDRDLSQAERKARQEYALDFVLRVAVSPGIGISGSRGGVAVRQLEPATTVGAVGDLTIAGVPGASNTFTTGALVAGTELALVNQAVPNNVFHCIYAVGFQVIPPALEPTITVIRFLKGAAGTPIFRAQLEPLYVNGTNNCPMVAWLSQPVIFKPQDPEWIGVMPRATNAAGERVILFGYIAEPAGIHVSRQEQL